MSGECRVPKTKRAARNGRPLVCGSKVKTAPQSCIALALALTAIPSFASAALAQTAGQSAAVTRPQKAISELEAAIAKAPAAPQSAKLYLQLGKLKRAYEDYPHSREGEDGDAYQRRQAEFESYAKARPEEYVYNEIGGTHLYNGVHFRTLQERFPKDPLVVDAAYEISKLSRGGECEGWVTCYISASFAPVRDFLRDYPDTKFSTEAVARTDAAFRKSTAWGEKWRSEFAEIADPHKDVDGYEAATLKTLVQEYEDLAAALPRLLRASAYETIAHYRARFGETKRARELYAFIVQHAPNYPRIAEVRKALAGLP